VSLVIPSTDWQLEPTSRSFDVAVRLTRPETGAKATLALVRQRMRNYKEFQKVVGEIESSMAAVPSYRSMGSGPMSLEPYTTYELRMTRELEGQATFNRIVVFYSRDPLVLSLSAQWRRWSRASRLRRSGSGFVIKRCGRLSFKGAPMGTFTCLSPFHLEITSSLEHPTGIPFQEDENGAHRVHPRTLRSHRASAGLPRLPWRPPSVDELSVFQCRSRGVSREVR
jgi:hypothetical protein